MKKIYTYIVLAIAAVAAVSCGKSAPEEVVLKSISIKPSVYKIDKGQSVQLKVTCQPENAKMPEITWASNKPTVADVDENGIVTGYTKGDAYITATAQTASGPVKASCQVSVSVPVYSLSLYYKGTSDIVPATIYGYPGQSVELEVRATDTNTHTYTWSSSKSDITVDANGKTMFGFGSEAQQNCQFYGKAIVQVSNEDGYNAGTEAITSTRFTLGGDYFELGSQVLLNAGVEYVLDAKYITAEGTADIPADLITIEASNTKIAGFSKKDGKWVLVTTKADEVVNVNATFAGKTFKMFSIGKNISSEGGLEGYEEITY